MDFLQSAEAMDKAIKAVISPAVEIWLNWMFIVFAASLLFVWKHKAARFVFGGFILSALIAVYIFHLTGSPHLVAISHLIVFIPLLIYIFKTHYKNPDFKIKSFYGIWLSLLSLTMVISLVFDVRDIILVMMGIKS